MPPAERIRLFLILINLVFIGCMHPDRAGQEQLASRRPDRNAPSGNRTAMAASSGNVTAIQSQAQNPEVVRAAGDDAWSPVKSASIAQVSGQEQPQLNSGPSTGRFSSANSGIPASPVAKPLTAENSGGTGPFGSTPSANPTEPRAPFAGVASSGGISGPSATTAAESSNKLRELYNQAALRYATIDSYVARLRRREFFKGKDQPEELILFKFRKQPWSVYFKWLGAEGQGREVVFVKGQHGNMIHSLLAAGDMPLAPAGKRMALSPDNIFVRSASRHSITEAGIGNIIEKFGLVLESQERGDKKLGPVNYLGKRKLPEFETPLDGVEHILPPGLEPQLPGGGRRWIFFDPASHLPVLTITQNDKGHEVEYYCYDRIQFPVRLDDLDFDPDKLWPGKK